VRITEDSLGRARWACGRGAKALVVVVAAFLQDETNTELTLPISPRPPSLHRCGRCLAASLPLSLHVTLASLSILHGFSNRSLDIAPRYTSPRPRPALTYHDETLPPPTTLARSPTNHHLLLQFALTLLHTRPHPLCLDHLPVRPARCHLYPASSSTQRIHRTPRSPQLTAYRGPLSAHCLLSATPQKPWSTTWARLRARGG
jgi:hypothetical protein